MRHQYDLGSLERVIQHFTPMVPQEYDDGAIGHPHQHPVAHNVFLARDLVSQMVDCTHREHGVLQMDVVVATHVRKVENIHGSHLSILGPDP